MQYKGLLLASFITLSAATVRGQKLQTGSAALNQHKSEAPVAVKSDTVAAAANQKAAKPAAGILAANLPVFNTKITTPPGMKPVPLAGQKAYFGTMNDYVNDYVRQYMRTHDRTLSVVQERSLKQFTLIESILEKHEVPKQLKYLAVIESALNNRAISPVGAAGPWQFMDFTAREFGLTVNSRRDDRTDWNKSTAAAAKYLTRLYSQLNDWLLVVAAYNSGPVPVQRAINRTGSRNFWDIKKYLPRETQGHVMAFIATASAFESMSQFIGKGGLPADYVIGEPYKPSAAIAKKEPGGPALPQFSQEELNAMVVVQLKDPLSMELMVQELAMDRQQMNRWNPDYDLFLYNNYSSDTYSLRLPKNKLDQFLEKKHHLTKRSRQIMEEATM